MCPIKPDSERALMSFSSLGLSAPILETIALRYSKPTPVQRESIPAILKGRDVMAAAQTGTGKTASFTLPILDLLAQGSRVRSNQVRALILVPTRELAAQVGDSVARYGALLPLRSTVVFGGVKINPQMMKLRKGVDILVATPGRLLDLHQQNAVKFNQLEILVMDEADRMLDMGFIEELKKIITLLPMIRQNLMFSATFSDEIRALAKTMVNNPIEISVNPANVTATTIEHWLYSVDKKQKNALLEKLIKDNDWQQVLVFCKTKQEADRLVRFLEQQGISAAPIHGGKSQAARTRALSEFKHKQIQILVATDLAARGLDIPQLPQVVNYNLPHVAQDYIHRIGRTGRAGIRGQAVSLVYSEEFDELAAVERIIQQLITRKIMKGFEPAHALPESHLDMRPIKPKKPKKPKNPKTG